MENKEYYTLEEFEDEFIPKGTKEREEYENEILEIKNEVLSKLIKSQPGLKGLRFNEKCYLITFDSILTGTFSDIIETKYTFIININDVTLFKNLSTVEFKTYEIHISKVSENEYKNLSKDEFIDQLKCMFNKLIDKIN